MRTGHEPCSPLGHMETLKNRVTARRQALEQELSKLGPDDHSRKDIEQALGAVDSLITGDLDHMSEVVSVSLSHWLETSKYLGEHHDAKTSSLPRLSTSRAAVGPPPARSEESSEESTAETKERADS